MEKRWVFKPEPDQNEVNNLAKTLKIPQKLAGLLVNRGIIDFAQSESFFRPSLEALHDPLMMKDMDRAIQRVLEAIENQDKVLVYGDYDVDGTTSVAMMYTYLSDKIEELEYYIPDRYKEGYGISDAGIQYAIDNQFDLIIALDCGIKAVDKIAKAEKAGVNVIVCDHHRPGDEIPDAIVLDPQRNDCTYPDKNLSGCGVGYKLIQGVENEKNGNWLDTLELLDFVAISIAADIVPIVGENRILASFGIEQINRETGRTGIDALIKVAKKDKPLTITDVVFTIAPRINAAGRLSDAKQAVALMIEKDESLASRQAQWIDENNQKRRDLDADITIDALQQIKEDELHGIRNTSVVYNPDWNKGIVGIVASRLIEQHYRPTIVLCESEGKAVGSARSVAGFDIYQALEECAEHIEQFGGHKYAAGMTIPLSELETFKKRFEEVVKSSIDPDLLVPQEIIEMELSFDEIITPEDGNGLPKFYRILNQFSPFGPGNMKPVFVTRGVKDTGKSKLIGNTKEHVKLHVVDDSGVELVGVAFGWGEHFENIQSTPFDLAYTLEENTWRGKTNLQFHGKAIRFI